MGKTPNKARSGLTLIELMVAMVVIVVGVLGAMMYRYHSALDARKADAHVEAGRVALLVMEGWKGAAGNADYDPSGDISLSSDITISSASSGVHTVELLGGTHTYYYAEPIKPPIDGDTNDLTGDGNNDPGLLKLEVEVTYYGKGLQNKTLPSKTIKVAGLVRKNPSL